MAQTLITQNIELKWRQPHVFITCRKIIKIYKISIESQNKLLRENKFDK